MVDDIARLGVVIEVEGAEKAGNDLDTLTKKGAKAEAALSNLGSGSTTTAKSVASVSSGVADVNKQFNYGAISAKQYTAALRGVPAQLTDIIVGLQGGQAPMTVLLQQGGQLKDMFGGVGNAAKALGGYLASLISPVTVAAGAVTGLGVAYYSGWKESEELRKSLIATGGVMGTTTAQVSAHASVVGELTGHYAKATEAAQALALSGSGFGDSLNVVLKGVVDTAIVTGREVSNVADDFERIARDPVKGLRDLNQQYHFLTGSTYDQVKALVEQGKRQEAVNFALNTYANSMAEKKGQIVSDIGYIEKAWKSVGSAISGVWTSLKEIGKPENLDELQKRLDQLTKQVERAQSVRTVQNIGQLPRLLEQQQQARAALDAANADLQKAQEASRKQEIEDRKIAQSDTYDRFVGAENRLTKSQALTKALNDERKAFIAATEGLDKNSSKYLEANARYEQGIKTIKESAAQEALRASGITKLTTSYDSLIQKSQDLVTGLRAELGIGEQLTNGQKAIREIREFLAQSTGKLSKSQIEYLDAQAQEIIQLEALGKAEEAKAERMRILAESQLLALQREQEYNEGLKATLKSVDDLVLGANKEAAAIQQQVLTMTMGASAVADMEQARLMAAASAYDHAAATQREEGATTQAIAATELMASKLRDLAAARRAVADASQEKERIEKAKDTAKEIQREYERMADNINRSLTDALLRGFESGKSFAENFRDTLKNMFSTLILRPIIQGVMQPVSDSISSIFGGGSAGGSGNLSAIANMARMLQGVSSGQSMSQILMGSIGNSIGNIGSSIGSAALSQFASGLAGRTVGTLVGQGPTVAGSATGLGSLAGSSLGSLGSFLGSYGGYIGAGIQALQGNFRGAAFTAAGAAIGSIIPGIGTAIGALVGSLIGSLTGGKDIKKYGSQATGTYSAGEYNNTFLGKYGNRDLGAGSGLDALNASFSQSLGNLLKSFGLGDSISTSSDLSARTNVRGGFYANFDGGSVAWGNNFGKSKRTDINAAFQSMVSSVMGRVLSEAIQKSKLPEGIRSLFSGITDKTKVETMIKSVLGLSRYQDELTEHYNLTADSAAKVAKASGLAGDELNAFLDKILSTTLGFRSSGAAMLDAKALLQEQLDSILDNVAVPETLKAFDAILKGIDTTNAEGIAQFSALFQLRDAMAEFTNSLGNIKTGVTDAIFGLKTPEQQLTVLQNNLKDAFAEVGLTVPKTVAELIALGESIDYTSEEGLTLAAVFPALVQGFLNTNEAAVSLASTLGLLDINKFKTQVDYVRAQHYAVTGNLSKLPSFDIGTNIVPKDMVAKIHEGERIIPAADNKELMQRLESPAGIDTGALEKRISAVESACVAVAKAVTSMERRMRKWDGDGLPPERLVTA